MGAAEALSPTDLREAMARYQQVLAAHQEVINRLNVFPVPDGDTGTNMRLTMEAVVDELGALGPDASVSEVCRSVAHGSLMGARGNSGVILSQLLRGVSSRIQASPTAGPSEVAEALAEASELARKAVVRPVEGTILTVAHAAGDGARAACAEGADLRRTLEAARDAARRALEATPTMLPVLAEAGVVDAGGAGYVLLIDALLSAIDGRPLPEPPAIASVPAPALSARPDVAEDLSRGLRYEVMYFLHAPDDTIPYFKEVWAGIGDSIVVVGGEGTWNCHIHTDDVGAAIEAALDCGRPRSIRVTDLSEQVEEERWVREHAGEEPVEEPAGEVPTTAVVAVVTGEGVGRIFRSLGVHHLVSGGQSMNPSTAEILKVVDALESEQVVVLPNNKNIRPVAEQVDALSAKAVRVVPTGSIVEGFAALLAYDPASGADANAAAMSASASRVQAGEVTQAVRDATTPAGPVREGDWIGLCDEGVVSIADSPAGAAFGLLAQLVDDHELVTVIEGEGSTPNETRRITEWLYDQCPDVSVEVHHGGQPLYPYLFGVE